MAKNPKDIEAQLARELEGIQFRKRASRLCPLLLTQIRALPEGIDLVCFISDSQKRNNRQALVDWIVRQLSDPAFQDDAEHQPEADLLSERLTRAISARAAANDACWSFEG